MTSTQTHMKEDRALQNLTLQVRRVIKGSRQRVFEAWTNPELLKQWFGPAALTVAQVSSDLKVGGAYRIEMEGVSANCVTPDNKTVGERRPVATGKYTEIIPYDRLRFTWRGDWGEVEDTLVTVEFKDVPGGTEVLLTHTNFATPEMKQGHNIGWTESFEKLAKFIER